MIWDHDLDELAVSEKDLGSALISCTGLFLAAAVIFFCPMQPAEKIHREGNLVDLRVENRRKIYHHRPEGHFTADDLTSHLKLNTAYQLIYRAKEDNYLRTYRLVKLPGEPRRKFYSRGEFETWLRAAALEENTRKNADRAIRDLD